FWIDIKNRKPINRFPIVSHQKDRSTDPYLIYIVPLAASSICPLHQLIIGFLRWGKLILLFNVLKIIYLYRIDLIVGS
ncbi:hypothetical protein CRN59_21520, partial [Vibrio vulnificus]